MKSTDRATAPITIIALLCTTMVVGGCGPGGSVEQRLDAASRSLQQGDYRKAIIQAKKILQADERNGRAWLVLAQASLAADNYGDAAHQFQQARAHGIGPDVTALGLAEALLANREPQEALKILATYDAPDKATQTNQHTLQGNGYLALEQLDEAAQAYTNALDINPDYAPALVGRAKLAEAKGDFEAALASLNRAIAAHPDYRPAILAVGELAYRVGNCVDAQPEFQKVLDLKGEQLGIAELFKTRILLVSCQLRTAEHEKAKENLARLLKVAPQNPFANYLQAIYEFQSSDYERAADHLQTALAAAPDDGRALLLMAAVKVRQNDPAAAKLYLKKVLAQSPANADALKLLSKLYIASDETDKALRLLQLAIHTPELSKDPANAAAVTYLYAIVLLYDGQKKEGIKALKEVVDTAPENSVYRFVLAQVELATGDTAAGIERLEKLRKDAPAFAPAAAKLAAAQLKQGNLQSALATAATLRQGPNPNAVAAATLEGLVYATVGQYAKADTAYQGAFSIRPSRQLALRLFDARRRTGAQEPARSLLAWLEKAPNDTAVALTLALWLQQQGRKDEARERYRIILKHDADNSIALNNLALLEAQRDSGEALALARRAHDAAPGHPAITDTLGWLLVTHDHLAEGLELLRVAAKPTENPDIRYHLAYALAHTEGVDTQATAKRILKELLASDTPFATRKAAENLQQELMGDG